MLFLAWLGLLARCLCAYLACFCFAFDIARDCLHHYAIPQSSRLSHQELDVGLAQLVAAKMANPTAQTPHMNSRPKRPPAGDEEAAATLRLGEFQDVPTLSLSEARTIVTAVVGRRKANKAQVADSETLVKTQEYLELFARFKEEDSVHAVANLLTARRELDSFEKSQLGANCPEYIDRRGMIG